MGGHFHSQTSFAYTGRSCEGEQAHIFAEEIITSISQLPATPQDARHGCGQIVGISALQL
jgi:hypothetical protein